MSSSKAPSILQRVVDNSWPDLTGAQAARLLSLQFSKEDASRMRVLGERAQDGELTKAERAELEEFVRVGHLISTLKVLARQLVGTGRRRATTNTPAARQRRTA